MTNYEHPEDNMELLGMLIVIEFVFGDWNNEEDSSFDNL